MIKVPSRCEEDHYNRNSQIFDVVAGVHFGIFVHSVTLHKNNFEPVVKLSQSFGGLNVSCQ